MAEISAVAGRPPPLESRRRRNEEDGREEGGFSGDREEGVGEEK